MTVAENIEAKLRAALTPTHLVVIDESHRHAGHAGAAEHAARRGNASEGGETHFNIEIESAAFTGLSRVSRHRLVYELLKDELSGGVHALALQTRAIGEPKSGG